MFPGLARLAEISPATDCALLLTKHSPSAQIIVPLFNVIYRRGCDITEHAASLTFSIGRTAHAVQLWCRLHSPCSLALVSAAQPMQPSFSVGRTAHAVQLQCRPHSPCSLALVSAAQPMQPSFGVGNITEFHRQSCFQMLFIVNDF